MADNLSHITDFDYFRVRSVPVWPSMDPCMPVVMVHTSNCLTSATVSQRTKPSLGEPDEYSVGIGGLGDGIAGKRLVHVEGSNIGRVRKIIVVLVTFLMEKLEQTSMDFVVNASLFPNSSKE